MRFQTFWIVLPALLLSHAGFCADPDSRKTDVMLDTVVVTAETANADFRTGDVDLETAPVFFNVIQREAFEGKTESLADVIEKEAGVQVRQSGGLGSFSSVSLRGSSSDQVMVFLDGVLLNDASGGGVDLSAISLSDVAAIEIYKGVTPIQFGKSSIGGAVNIRTLRARDGFSGSAAAGYGSFNTRKFNALINHKPGAWDVMMVADHLASDNDFDVLNDNGTKWNTLDDRWEQRNNAEVDQYNLLAKAGYDVADTMRVDLVNQWFQKDQGLPSWDNSSLTDTSLETTRNITTLNLLADDLTDLGLNTRTQVSYTWKEEEYEDKEGHVGLGEQHSTYTTTRLGGEFFIEWPTEHHMLAFNANMYHEAYDTADHLNKQNPVDSTRDAVSLGLQDSLFFFEETLIVAPALRYTWIKDRLEGDTSIWGTELTEATREDNYLSPRIGVKFAPLPWLILKTNLARYVREPSFFELFGDRGFFIGNSDLKEEKGVNFDMGAQVEWHFADSWLRRLSVEAAYFRTDADDLITRVYDSRGIGRSVNISGACIQGVESEARIDILDYFRIILNATWQDPENQSDIPAFDGKNLPGHFETAFTGRIEARYNGLKVHAEYIRNDDMYYDTANLLKAEDQEEINAGLTWVYRQWTFSLEGKNVNDDLYEDFNGYPLPGRSVYGSVKYAF